MITHLQLVNPADITRFAALDVIAVPQPYWFVIHTDYTQAVEFVGQARADQQYPMRSFFDQGVTVASASDYPVSWPPDPLLAIEIGVRRAVPARSEIYLEPDFEKALVPAESVTVEQMIESFTRNGDFAAFLEDEICSLEVGKKADFIVVDQNILEIDPAQIHNTIILLTYFVGREVYRSEAYPEQAQSRPLAPMQVAGQDSGKDTACRALTASRTKPVPPGPQERHMRRLCRSARGLARRPG